MIEIACVVEGDGDVLAVPVLLRRLAVPVEVQVHRPLRMPRNRLDKPGHLERFCELAARQTARRGAVLVLFDSDDDCPRDLAPRLLLRVQTAIGETPCAVVFAHREFEAWFLAAIRSLLGKRGLPHGLQVPSDPEAVRGAKEWLAARRQGVRAYSPKLDQPAFASLIDLEQARSAPSFDKLCRELDRLLALLTDRST